MFRVEKLTGKSIDFYEVDLKNIEDVKTVFQKVNQQWFMFSQIHFQYNRITQFILKDVNAFKPIGFEPMKRTLF